MEETLKELLEAICKAVDWPAGHACRIVAERPLGLLPTGCWYLRQPGRYRRPIACTRRTAEVAATSESLGTGLPRRLAAARAPALLAGFE